MHLTSRLSGPLALVARASLRPVSSVAACERACFTPPFRLCYVRAVAQYLVPFRPDVRGVDAGSRCAHGSEGRGDRRETSERHKEVLPGLDASGLGGDRRLQELLRPAGAVLQGRRDGHRGPERLRQEQHLRRDQLGARRAEREEPARHVDGGRDLQRQLEPPAAADGRGEPQGLRPQRQQPRRQPRVRGDAPALPQRRERVPDERPDLSPARHPRAVHGHRARLEGVLDHRAGQDRPDPLVASPADRRAIIEEAAGITKYKARRRQTQLKLEAAQQNLLRVNDIVNEVEKQLESLKRQAAKARRWRAVKEEMQGVERVLFGRRFVDLGERSARARGAARGRGRARARGERSPSRPRRRSSRPGGSRSTSSRRGSRRCAGGFNELTLAVDRHQGRSGYCKQQLAENEVRAQQAAREEQELVSRVGPLTETLAGRRAEEQKLHDELGAAEAELGAAEAAVAEAGARQAEAEAGQERGRESQVALLGRIADAPELARVGGRQRRARRRRPAEARRGDLEELERERARVGAAREAAHARGREAEALLAELGGARDAATARADEARARAEALGREADALQSERDGLAGRLASLEEMVATHSAFDEGVRALLSPAGGPRGARRRGRRPRDRLRARARGGGVPRRPPAGGARARRRAGPARHPLAAVLGRRAAGPSCPWPRPAPATTAGRCARSRPRSRRRSACCPTSTAWAAPTPTASAPRSPTRSSWRPSRTRSRWPRGRARSRW